MEVLKRLKSEPDTREIPVVMLTADASKTRSEHALLVGASAYLTKPLDIGSFLDSVTQHLLLPSPEKRR
jgi:CheY-like chemotaxis protein